MLKKYGKFFADWRDPLGKRHRKACQTKSAALRLQSRMRRENQAKKAQASAR